MTDLDQIFDPDKTEAFSPEDSMISEPTGTDASVIPEELTEIGEKASDIPTESEENTESETDRAETQVDTSEQVTETDLSEPETEPGIAEDEPEAGTVGEMPESEMEGELVGEAPGPETDAEITGEMSGPEMEAESVGEPEPDNESAGETSEEKAPAYTDAQVSPVAPDEPKLYPQREPYDKRYYLLYGADSVPESIDLQGTSQFLKELGFGNNFLKMAREGRTASKLYEEKFKDKTKKIYCDFCGRELTGAEVNILKDGRVRCSVCEKSAIKDEAGFIKLYSDVVDNIKLFFNVEVERGVKIKLTNARTLHKKIKKNFVPTAEPTARVLGVAIKDKDGFSIYLENGSPRLATIKTLVHELTHIWQYQNWDEKKILHDYGRLKNVEIYEGMAKWVETQYMYLLGEAETARREEENTLEREDEYGRGFKMYLSNYPLSYGMVLEGATPFDDPSRPL